MSTFGPEEALSYIHQLLRVMQHAGGSDLFISADFPPSMKSQGAMKALSQQKLTGDITRKLALALMNDKQKHEFESEMECNFAISLPNVCRFRVNVFVQQQQVAMVIRTIASEIPNFQKLELPEVLKEVIMTKRGLVIVVGATGSGKSTSLAAMVDWRNENAFDHIITVEDPVEFVHPHKNCVVTQREIGVDTDDWQVALKNSLRQAPDVILMGEIRDHETMELAINFAETGHLCIATIHANNAGQTVERVLNFFPEERHTQILLNLSLNLRATLSQRLIPTISGSRTLALEIMLNHGLIRQHIEQGKVRQLREMIEKGASDGMQTFDQNLFDLYQRRIITEEIAIAESDSAANLRLMIQNKKASERTFEVSIRQDVSKANPSDF